MLSKTEQHRHERIALFPTLSLQNVVDASEIILPQESGRPPAEHPDEGQDAIAAVHAHEPLQHCIVSERMVNSSMGDEGQCA